MSINNEYNYGQVNGHLYADTSVGGSQAASSSSVGRRPTLTITSAPVGNGLPPIEWSILERKIVTDDDIRALMKELIKAFTMLINCQRQGELNDLNGIMQALEDKLSSMGEARDEAKRSALATAISTIVGGALSVAGGVLQGVFAGMSVGARKAGVMFDETSGQQTLTEVAKAKGQDYANMIQTIGSLTQAVQQLSQGAGGSAAAAYNERQSTAQIEQEQATALLEFWKQNQQMDQKESESFFNFLKTILSILQEYRQNQSTTELNIARMA